MSLSDKDRVDDEEVIVDNEVEENEEIETDPIPSEDSNEEDVEGPEIVQEDTDEEEEDRVVTIGDSVESDSVEEEKQEAPAWVKKVRKKNRTLESENKKLQRQLEALSKPKEVEIKLGSKPTLADADYDEAVYDQKLTEYYERKRKVELQTTKQAELVKAQNERVQGKITNYVESKKKHNFKDYSEAESIVENTLSQTQQNIIVQGADDSALLVYAMGKNPKKLDELSQIQDPVEFAFKIAKLESQLKVSNRKAPSPEKRVSKGKPSGLGGNTDKTLERLREKAQKTGDYTEVRRYKKTLRSKG